MIFIDSWRCGVGPLAVATGFTGTASLGLHPPEACVTNASVCYNDSHLVVTFACQDDHVHSDFPRGCYPGRPSCHGCCDGCGYSGPLFQQSSTELFIAKGLSGTYPPVRSPLPSPLDLHVLACCCS